VPAGSTDQEEVMALAPGTPAPDFSLKDQGGNAVSLADFRGSKSVLLVFYPFTFTGVCQGELCDLRDDLNRYDTADVQVLACSCDSPFAQKKWAEEMGYQFPVLSDYWPHGAVAQAYGVFNEAVGCANRGTFLIDRDGTIVDVIESDSLGTAREKGAHEAALAKL
jgi:peroxiredoxin (alkyl hydroperoxide reductase subunit C)